MRKKPAYPVLIILAVFLYSCSQNQQLVPGENYAQLSSSNIWHHVIGNGDQIPILMLHGGPGGSSASLYALADLSINHPIIIFDQAGTGKSGHLTDTALMNMEFMVGQLNEFIHFLGLKKYYIYGHSWGCMLGLDYYLKYPEGVQALVLNSPLVSTERWIRDADSLIATLPDSIGAAIEFHEQNQSYDSREYRVANYIYYKNFILRNERVKSEYATEPEPGNNEMYNYMWGPSEFTATGILRDYDRTADLQDIKIPVLFIAGEFDEATPNSVKYFSTLTPFGKFSMIDGAAHATMHDNQGQNIAVIEEFLKEIENR